jgi:hypothetical protein
MLVPVVGCSSKPPAPAVAAAPLNRPDLTIRTKTVFSGTLSQTTTLQFKGARERHQSSLNRGGVEESISITIEQCDLQRSVVVSEAAKTFASWPIDTGLVRGARGRVPSVAGPPPGGPEVIVTIDSVDAGERRQVGSYAARHIVTTTTEDREGSPTIKKEVKDGWYIDVGPQGCGAAGTSFLYATNAGESVRIVQRGNARPGIPLEESDWLNPAEGAFIIQTTLVELSEGRIDAAQFAVPAGYRRALPLPGGGFDLSRPDTLSNRASVYWVDFAEWVKSIVR